MVEILDREIRERHEKILRVVGRNKERYRWMIHLQEIHIHLHESYVPMHVHPIHLEVDSSVVSMLK